VVAAAAWRLKAYSWVPKLSLGFQLGDGSHTVRLNSLASRRKFWFTETLGIEVGGLFFQGWGVCWGEGGRRSVLPAPGPGGALWQCRQRVRGVGRPPPPGTWPLHPAQACSLLHVHLPRSVSYEWSGASAGAVNQDGFRLDLEVKQLNLLLKL
jgi:hypothetical protein